MNYKIKVVIITVIAAMLVLFLSGGVMIASAEEGTYPVTQEEVKEDLPGDEISEEDEGEEDAPSPDPEEPLTGDTELTDEEMGADFIEWLKATFGSDYEYYYNQIINNWGTIEDYLLQFGQDNLPDSLQLGWNKVVSWLGKYVVIWAPPLLIAIIIAYYFFRKRSTKKMLEKIVDSKMTVLSNELNKQSRAIMSIGHGQKALLGKNARFADTVKEIDDTEKELKS